MPANPWETIVWQEQQLNQYSGWLNLDATFRSRLLSLFAASGGQLGFGEGFRSPEQQASGYAAKPGVVAPPGKSWHEVGMAVDLTGPAVNNGWLEANAAKFGLKTFATVNDEPWHVQPIEIPNARPSGATAPALSGSTTGMSGTTPTTTGSLSTGPQSLPSDAKVVAIAGTYDVYAVFDVGSGISLAYKIDTGSGVVDWKSRPLTTLTQEQWQQAAPIMAGDSAELGPVSVVFGNFKEFWDKTLAEVMGPFNPARNDPEVLRVIAEFAARPDMSEAELNNKLQATSWFQQRTQEQLQWNGLSEAEKQMRRAETAAQAAETWFRYVGEAIGPDDPRIANYIEDLASGKIGWGAFSQIIKSQALEFSESPHARTVRDEKEAQLQRGVDIENTAQKIRRQLERWGLKWTDQEIMSWAKGIVSNERTDDDLLNTIQTAAQVLYPWKDPTQETIAAAQPWLETYQRVMEKNGTLFTGQIQAAMSRGQSSMEFEQDLKRSDEWLTTKNAKTELTGLIGAMGSKMGFF